MSTLMRRLAWTGQVIAIYLLAEFAIFTISGKAMRALVHAPDPAWWVTLIFYFLPLTVSAWWMLGVLFGPRPPQD